MYSFVQMSSAANFDKIDLDTIELKKEFETLSDMRQIIKPSGVSTMKKNRKLVAVKS